MAQHLLKVKEYESKQISKAKERQAIFEQAFETEIQQYKESGIIPSKSQLLVDLGNKFNTEFFVLHRIESHKSPNS